MQQQNVIIGLTKYAAICMYCKKIRDEKHLWKSIEKNASVLEKDCTHAICPDCYQTRVLPEIIAHINKLKDKPEVIMEEITCTKAGELKIDGKTVLVIDDEAEYRMMLRERLQANGYGVLEAGDGEEGIEAFRSRKPDIVLLDILLPKLDGFEVAKLIRKHDPNVLLIILSAMAQDKDIKTGMLSGANAYLTKPCDSSKLLDSISTLLKS